MNTPEQPPAGKRDEYTRERMQKIAQLVNEELPRDWGFFVMAFPMGAEDGRMNYVSNGRREDIVKLMQEFIDKGGFREGHHADELTDLERVAVFLQSISLRVADWSQAELSTLYQVVTGWQMDRVNRAMAAAIPDFGKPKQK